MYICYPWAFVKTADIIDNFILTDILLLTFFFGGDGRPNDDTGTYFLFSQGH